MPEVLVLKLFQHYDTVILMTLHDVACIFPLGAVKQTTLKTKT